MKKRKINGRKNKYKIFLAVIISIFFLALIFFELNSSYNFTGEVVAVNKNNIEETSYIYGNGLVASVDKDGLKYYHNDFLGSPTVISDSRGNKVSEQKYDVFGDSLLPEISTLEFTGKEKDDDTGLHYFNARYYNSPTGKFLTADSVKGKLSNPQSLNLYSYTLNNPLKYVDPSGNQEEPNNRRIVFGVNVMLGGIRGAIAARTNKENILEGFAKGALGGAVSYGGKELAGFGSRNYPLALAGKQIHSLGMSMIENLERDRGMLSSYTTNFGPLYYTFGKTKEGGEYHSIKDIPVGIIGLSARVGLNINTVFMSVIFNVAEKAKPDPKASLGLMTPVFTSSSLRGGKAGGGIFGEGIQTTNDYLDYASGHELIHTLQVREMMRAPYWYGGGEAAYMIPQIIQTERKGFEESVGWYYHNPMEYEAHTLDKGE